MIRGFDMKYLALLFATLIPGIAMGAGWETCEDMTGDTKGTISPFTERCVDLASGDLSSDILYTGMCDNFDVVYNADTSGSGTAISVQVLSCVMATASTNNCLAIDNVTLTGAASSFEILGAAASWIYVVGTGTIGSETPRVLVRCNQ